MSEMQEEKKKIDFVKKAHDFAKKAHEDQVRDSGEPYFIHPEAVAKILIELGLDDETVAAGYLHDVVEDCDYTYEDIEREFNVKIANLVKGVTKLDKMNFASREEAQAENTRNMMMAMADDIGVILIKLADRLHNMRTLQFVSEKRKQAIAKETLDIYAPLAHRLGIGKVKWELEDLSFSYLDNETYTTLAKKVKTRRQVREEIVNNKIEQIEQVLKKHKISAVIEGRPKHFYSIYKKMKSSGKPFEELYDLTAIRIIVGSTRDCYGALGAVHEIWTPIPGRFKDYIAMPKKNGYRSIHTTLMGVHGAAFEIQIRTEAMHKTAEYGIAAHWMYKENKGEKNRVDKELATFRRQILELKDSSANAMEFLTTLKVDLVQETVYVFTPKGDVHDLPVGSTPIDFAYRIHSAVGNKCTGAKINGKIVTLDTKLKTGDIVEIITSNNSHGPSRDWLAIAKTSQARSKIRTFFKKQGKEDNIIKGKSMLDEMMRKGDVSKNKLLKNDNIENVCHKLAFLHFDDVLAAIGYGELTTKQVYMKLLEEHNKGSEAEEVKEEETPEIIQKELRPKNANASGGVIIKGERNMLVKFAGCCNPVPFDPIVGFITRGKGVSIHRQDCYNVTSSGHDPSRYIEAEWEHKVENKFVSTLHISMHDTPGLLLRVSHLMSSLNVSLVKLNAEKTPQNVAIFDLTVELANAEQLVTLIQQLKKMPESIQVYRKNG